MSSIFARKKSGKASLRKKGLMKTVVTIFAILFLVFLFIVFVFLFKFSAKSKTNSAESDFSSINSEYALKAFLRTPAYSTHKTPAQDITGDVGETVTNTDLVSWTCNNDKEEYNKNYLLLKNSINSFFDEIYGNDWELEIIYPDSEVKTKKFGHRSLLDRIFSTAKYSTASTGYNQRMLTSSMNGSKSTAPPVIYREEGFASQYLPCSGNGFAAVMLKATEKEDVKGLKIG